MCYYILLYQDSLHGLCPCRNTCTRNKIFITKMFGLPCSGGNFRGGGGLVPLQRYGNPTICQKFLNPNKAKNSQVECKCVVCRISRRICPFTKESEYFRHCFCGFLKNGFKIDDVLDKNIVFLAGSLHF
jgi:hypothetical protein